MHESDKVYAEPIHYDDRVETVIYRVCDYCGHKSKYKTEIEYYNGDYRVDMSEPLTLLDEITYF